MLRVVVADGARENRWLVGRGCVVDELPVGGRGRVEDVPPARVHRHRHGGASGGVVARAPRLWRGCGVAVWGHVFEGGGKGLRIRDTGVGGMGFAI